MRLPIVLWATAVASAVATGAMAQSVAIRFEDGYVTMAARNVPLREILAEWSRVGSTRVINGESLEQPVTIELERISERQALSTLLRDVSGYIASGRDSSSVGASIFGIILVNPAKSRVAGSAAAATPHQLPAAPPEPATATDEDEAEERRLLQLQLFGRRDDSSGDSAPQTHGARDAAEDGSRAEDAAARGADRSRRSPAGSAAGARRPGPPPAPARTQ